MVFLGIQAQKTYNYNYNLYDKRKYFFLRIKKTSPRGKILIWELRLIPDTCEPNKM